MIDYSTRRFPAMLRLISAHTLLCTEMVAADKLLDARRSSRGVPEGPSVLQFGGNDASQLLQAANLYDKVSRGNKIKYTSLNLNFGCPIPAVSGEKCFGAALMRDTSHVAKLVREMNDGVEGKLPISVKCRIGLYGTNNNTPFMREIYNKQSEKEEFDKLRTFSGKRWNCHFIHYSCA